MHVIEGMVAILAGTFAWSIASGRLPADPQKREQFYERVPWAKNKYFMYGMTAFLWLFGLAVVLGFIR